MAELPNFYLPPDQWHPPYSLTHSEAHHLSKVLRIKTGENVRLFDGQGKAGIFVVTGIEKNKVLLEPVTITTSLPPTTRCTLAAGFSKALRRSWFLEKAVELEVHALWFWQGDHSQATLPGQEKETWRASLIAGAKQCGNPWLPEITMLPGGAAALASQAASFDRAYVLYEGDTVGRLLTQEDLRHSGSVLLVIGPEGGFSQQEITTLSEADILPVSLGSSILRWETAAVITLGIAWWARQ